MAKRANGTGTVRKVTRMIGGKKYEYWEARYTDGVDLGTGKQRRRSITGKTQKEVMQKLTAATAAIDSGTYIQPSKQTLGQWLDVWEKTYLSGVKPRTRAIYADNIRLHIKPALGAVRLEALNTHEIQQFYNALGEPSRTRKAGLAPQGAAEGRRDRLSALQSRRCLQAAARGAQGACAVGRRTNYGIFADHQGQPL